MKKYIILLLLIVLTSMIFTGCKKEQQTAAPIVENKTVIVEQEIPRQEAAEMLEDKNCGEGTAVGYKACSYLPDGDINVTLEKKPSARVNVNASMIGVRIIFLSLDKDPATKENIPVGNTTIDGKASQGKIITYTVSTSNYPNAERLEIRPIIEDQSGKRICYNQRIMLIPKTNCKKI